MMAPQAEGQQLHASAVPVPGCPAWTVALGLHACSSVRCWGLRSCLSAPATGYKLVIHGTICCDAHHALPSKTLQAKTGER